LAKCDQNQTSLYFRSGKNKKMELNKLWLSLIQPLVIFLEFGIVISKILVQHPKIISPDMHVDIAGSIHPRKLLLF
jgi:hypothetical protein